MGQGNFFTPQTVKDERAGVRPSVASLLALIDTTDPALRHILRALQDMSAAGVGLNQTTIEIAMKVGKQKHADDAAKRHAKPERKSIVYYIRRGELIKIGTTVRPAVRFKSLMPDEILAFEPGDVELERARHREFDTCRVAKKGEYFQQADVLLAHIADLRGKHGLPPAAWPTTATLGTGYSRTREKPVLPAPATGEVATATDGAKLLGMKRATIYGWVRRGLIAPADKDESGHSLYYVEQMRFLIDRNRAWMNHSKHRSPASN